MNIEGMQFCFVLGKGTTDAVFIARQLQKFLGNKKQLHFVFVDLGMSVCKDLVGTENFMNR